MYEFAPYKYDFDSSIDYQKMPKRFRQFQNCLIETLSRFRENPKSVRHFQNCLIKAVISGKSLKVSDISRTDLKQSFPGKA